MVEIPLPCLCLVTDRHQCQGRPLEEVVDRAIHGGVNLVQLREKDLPAARLLELAQRLRDVTRGRALLFVNDRLDVALASQADGVQLGEEGLPVEAAGRIAGGRLITGRSVHSAEGAATAAAQGADLLIVGTVFPTGSHPGAATGGVSLLREVASRTRAPFLAIGGVKRENVAEVIQAGASGAAVITAVTQSPDPERAARELSEEMRRVWDLQHEGRVASSHD